MDERRFRKRTLLLLSWIFYTLMMRNEEERS